MDDFTTGSSPISLFTLRDALYPRRERCAAILEACRHLNASCFTVDELALILGTSPWLLDDAGLARIEDLAARHRTEFFDPSFTVPGVR